MDLLSQAVGMNCWNIKGYSQIISYVFGLFLQKVFGYEIKKFISIDSRTFACCRILAPSQMLIVRWDVLRGFLLIDLMHLSCLSTYVRFFLEKILFFDIACQWMFPSCFRVFAISCTCVLRVEVQKMQSLFECSSKLFFLVEKNCFFWF